MKRLASVLIFVALASLASATALARTPSAAPRPLVTLFTEWRNFNHPAIVDGRPNYSAATMAAKAQGLANFRARLRGIGTAGWPIDATNDYRLVEAEMNGLDFFLRVLRPWARDPTFYATVFPEMSDVPAHEGPSAEPNIDLFAYRFPLSRSDDAQLTLQLAAIPALLDDAKVNLASSQARDLWSYGDRAFVEQADALAAWQRGKLEVRDLGGRRSISLASASPGLKAAVEKARAASVAFAAWVKTEAPKRRGPSGVGKDNYNWFLKNVLLSPLDYDQQMELLQRELDRSIASMRLEEARNGASPPIPEDSDPVTFDARSKARAVELYRLWVRSGIIADKPYSLDALVRAYSPLTPAGQRNFFQHLEATDPVTLSTHEFHWIELARRVHDPNPDPIRAATPLFNMYAERSEGFATAMEELSMQLGIYDREPHGRELAWIMIANRAARGLASLRVQGNEIGLDEAGRFHAAWTPRGWSDPRSKLVGFEQLLYLRQPGYGPSYIVGKAALDQMLAAASHQAEATGRRFSLKDTFDAIWAAGIVPPAIIQSELPHRLK